MKKRKNLKTETSLAKATQPQEAGLGNPLVTIAAAQATSEATKVIPFVLKWVFMVGLGYFAYTKIFNKFRPLNYISNYPNANISDSEAQNRADAIYQSMVGLGANVQSVAANLAGLNYNGWIKVYNAFGTREGSIPFSGKLNLVEWLNDQFNEEEIMQLRFVLPGVF